MRNYLGGDRLELSDGLGGGRHSPGGGLGPCTPMQLGGAESYMLSWPASCEADP